MPVQLVLPVAGRLDAGRGGGGAMEPGRLNALNYSDVKELNFLAARFFTVTFTVKFTVTFTVTFTRVYS